MTSPSDVEIRIVDEANIENVVAIHCAALPNDILPNLGKKIIRKYYKNIMSDDSQLLIGAFINKELRGFVQFSRDSFGVAKFVDGFNTIATLIRAAIIRPNIFYAGCMQMFKAKRIEGAAEISFIAVLPEQQGKGIGSKLLGFITEYGLSSNIETISTKTANKELRDFYIKKYGAKEIYHFSVGKNTYYQLIWPCSIRQYA